VYRDDPHWTPPLPSELQETFDPAANPPLAWARWCRWVLTEGEQPRGRIAAFAPAGRPHAGYFGFFESPDDSGAAAEMLHVAEEWLESEGRHDVYGPIAVTPRDTIGMLVQGFASPALLFTPYNPPYYPELLERSGYLPIHYLRAYGWRPDHGDYGVLRRLADRAASRGAVRVRSLNPARLDDEVRLVVQLLNATLRDAWHFEPVSEVEAARFAAQLGPVLDRSMALLAEDRDGPCGICLALPDAWWLWRRAGASVLPFGWARLLRWRRRIPHARLLALGVLPRARGSGAIAQLIERVDRAARTGHYTYGELSQVYEDNTPMLRVLDRLRLPVVRRYAVYRRNTAPAV
jgi:GNAT superfamily N-acetyltransferase